jgi:hypothetical protein
MTVSLQAESQSTRSGFPLFLRISAKFLIPNVGMDGFADH